MHSSRMRTNRNGGHLPATPPSMPPPIPPPIYHTPSTPHPLPLNHTPYTTPTLYHIYSIPYSPPCEQTDARENITFISAHKGYYLWCYAQTEQGNTVGEYVKISNLPPHTNWMSNFFPHPPPKKKKLIIFLDFWFGYLKVPPPITRIEPSHGELILDFWIRNCCIRLCCITLFEIFMNSNQVFVWIVKFVFSKKEFLW